MCSHQPSIPSLTELLYDRLCEIRKDLTIHKYLLNTYSVPGPEPAAGNQTDILIYSSKISCKGKLRVMGNKRAIRFAQGKQRRPSSRERMHSWERHSRERKGPPEDPEVGTCGVFESHRTSVRWAHSRLALNKCQLNKLTTDHKDSCFQPRWSNRDWTDIPA